MPDDELEMDRNPISQREPAEFVAQWRDYDDEAIRTCSRHLGASVKKLYHDFGHSSQVTVFELNESAGFKCEFGDNVWDKPDAPYADETERRLAEWAATQPPDNFVNTLKCGHEVDSPNELIVGQYLKCSVHGPQEIIDPADPPRD